MKDSIVRIFQLSFFCSVILFLFLIFNSIYHQHNKQFDKALSPVSSAWDNHGWWLSNCPIPKELGNKNYHSQYYEDYILSLIFSDVQKGIYIDVGAHHPDKESVTKYFYLLGWNGINIDPLKGSKDLFERARPHDINLEVGASNETKVLLFHQVQKTGLSSFSDENLTRFEQYGFNNLTYEAKVRPLNSILKEYPQHSIDFIKIDVEGYEREVLEGIDLVKHRPKVFVIEATVPYTLLPSHERFEDILLQNHYLFVLFDGLNRYYLAKEHDDLLDNMMLASKCACFANRITNRTKIPEFDFYFNKRIVEETRMDIKGRILNYYFAENLL